MGPVDQRLLDRVGGARRLRDRLEAFAAERVADARARGVAAVGDQDLELARYGSTTSTAVPAAGCE